jgi:hypothetical protein
VAAVSANEGQDGTNEPEAQSYGGLVVACVSIMCFDGAEESQGMGCV